MIARWSAYLCILALVFTINAAEAREKQGFGYGVALAFTTKVGCEAELTRFSSGGHFVKRSNHKFRLPRDKDRLVDKLRPGDYARFGVNIYALGEVPDSCSRAALDAVRAAKPTSLGYSIRVDPKIAPERVALCDLANDPSRWLARRIAVRGTLGVHMTPDDVTMYLADNECPQTINLQGGNFQRDPEGRRADVVGTTGANSCDIPLGHTTARPLCGAYIRVDKVDDVGSSEE